MCVGNEKELLEKMQQHDCTLQLVKCFTCGNVIANIGEEFAENVKLVCPKCFKGYIIKSYTERYGEG